MNKYSDKQREKIINAICLSLEGGSSLQRACKEAGHISEVTFYKWRRQDEALANRVEEIYDSRIGNVEDALYRDAVKGNTSAQIFFLKNRAKHKWKDQREQHNTGDTHQTIIYVTNRDIKQISSSPRSEVSEAVSKEIQDSNSR